jgi:hypothetical protein
MAENVYILRSGNVEIRRRSEENLLERFREEMSRSEILEM